MCFGCFLFEFKKNIYKLFVMYFLRYIYIFFLLKIRYWKLVSFLVGVINYNLNYLVVLVNYEILLDYKII